MAAIDDVKMLVDGTGHAIPQWYDVPAGIFRPVSAQYPMPTADPGIVISETIAAVTAGAQAQPVIAANPARKYLSWMIVGTQDVTISTSASVIAGAGMVYQASGPGRQGASQEFRNGAPTNAFYAVAPAAGSNIIIWEGV